MPPRMLRTPTPPAVVPRLMVFVVKVAAGPISSTANEVAALPTVVELPGLARLLVTRIPPLETMSWPVKLSLPVRTSIPAPVLVRLPAVPVMSPVNSASTAALPLSTWIVRTAVPKSMGLVKVTLWVASEALKIKVEPVGTNQPLPQATPAEAPPRLTTRSAP